MGGAVGAALPTTAVGIGAAVIFFGFAIWTLLDDDEDVDAGVRRLRRGGRRAVHRRAGGQGMQRRPSRPIAVRLGAWIGGTAGELAAGVLAVVAGHPIGERLSRRTTRFVSAVLFAAFGLLLLVGALV